MLYDIANIKGEYTYSAISLFNRVSSSGYQNSRLLFLSQLEPVRMK
jgi:hypothetical protein